MTDDEMVRRALEELRELTTCRCHPAFKERKLHDPDCDCDSAEAVGVVADRIGVLKAERDALTAERDDVRYAALEEAAKVADRYSAERIYQDEFLGELKCRTLQDPRRIAAAIRALDPAAIAAKMKGEGDAHL